MSWWKAVGAYKYPIMTEIAKDILAIPISLVASKSALVTEVESWIISEVHCYLP
ncbi:hypothetical protein LINPERPRIM_LOCUS30313 [Linum perenne]